MIDLTLVGTNAPTFSSPHITLVKSRINGCIYAAMFCLCDSIDIVLLIPFSSGLDTLKASYNTYFEDYLCIDSNTSFIISNTNL